MRHQVFALGLAETFLHRALDAHQARAELVFRQFADAAHATVAEVVDVVDFALAVAQLDEDLDRREDVVVLQRHRARDLVTADAAVELHAADLRQVVRVFAVEQAVEERLDGFFRRRLARAHHPVDRDARGRLVDGFVHAQRRRDVRALVQIVRVERLDFLDLRFAQLLEHAFGDLVVRVRDHFTRVAVDDVLRQHAAEQIVFGHRDVLGLRGFEIANVLRVDPLVLLDDDLAFAIGDVEARDFAAQTLGHELHLRAFVHQREVVEDEEVREDLLRREADRLQQDRDRHLAAAVDAEIQHVLRIEFEVEPRAAVRNDPRGEQQLARAVRLALVVLEEHAGRTVQLRHDHALGAVDDERTGRRHERNLAHVHFLFLHFLDDGLARRLLVEEHEAHLRAQRRAVGQAALLTFLDVERRRRQRIAHELETSEAVMRDDGKHRREGGLQPLGLALRGGHIGLQKCAE